MSESKVPLIVGFCCFAFSWLLPNHVPPFTAGYQDFLALFAILALGTRFHFFVRLDCRFFVVCFIGLIPVLQWFSGKIFFIGDACLAAAYVFFFWLALMVSSGLNEEGLSREKFLSVFFISLVFASVVSVWIAVRQWLLLSGAFWEAELPLNGRPFANIAQPNNLATLLSMGLVGVLYFYEKNKLGCLTSGVLSFWLLFGIALTQSRTPWVVLPAMLLYWVLKHRHGLRLTQLGFAVIVGGYVCLVFLLPTLSSALLLSQMDLYDRASSLQRLDLWWQLLHAALEGPVWGYGWNQVSVAQVYISQAYPVPLMTEHSHNVLLDLLLWNGPVVGGVIILFLAWWLVGVLWRSHSVESLCSMMAACSVIVHGMLEFPLEYAYLLMPLGLLLGVAISEDSTAKVVKVPLCFNYGAVCVLGVLLLWSFVEYRSVEEDYRQMRFETAGIGHVDSSRLAPSIIIFTQLREFIRFARTPAAEGMSEADIKWMRNVAHRYPYPPSLFRYSLALGLNGYFGEAREQLSILRALHGEEHYLEALRSVEDMSRRYPQLQEVY